MICHISALIYCKLVLNREIAASGQLELIWSFPVWIKYDLDFGTVKRRYFYHYWSIYPILLPAVHLLGTIANFFNYGAPTPPQSRIWRCPRPSAEEV